MMTRYLSALGLLASLFMPILAQAAQTILMHDKLGQILRFDVPDAYGVTLLGHGDLPVGRTAARVILDLPSDTAQEIAVQGKPEIRLRFAPPGATRNMISALATQYHQPAPALVQGLNGYINNNGNSILLIEQDSTDPDRPALWVCDYRPLQLPILADCMMTITEPHNLEIRYAMIPDQAGISWTGAVAAIRSLTTEWNLTPQPGHDP